MKKIVLLAFILMAFMAVSCEDFSLFEKDTLEVDKDSLTFRATEQRLSFHITTNGAWRIVENPSPNECFTLFLQTMGTAMPGLWLRFMKTVRPRIVHRNSL